MIDADFESLAKPLLQHLREASPERDNIDPHRNSLVALDDADLIRRVRREGPASQELRRRLTARHDPSKLIAAIRDAIWQEKIPKQFAAELGIGD